MNAAWHMNSDGYCIDCTSVVVLTGRPRKTSTLKSQRSGRDL